MTTHLLDLHGLTRTFGAMTALDGITLTLPPGRIGLLGPNGAGKSTLLKLLMGLLPPSDGFGFVLDQPLGGDRDGAANWQLRRLIGFMPEADSLVPGLTGVEYVSLAGELYGMSRRQAQRRAHEVLSYLELEEARYRLVEQYSAGMKQRVKLAQALVHDPPVLLLDEPTSGLDPAGRDAMLRLIRELSVEHGKSTILSTHLLADVQAVCERVVIIAGGKVRGVGTVDELLARRGDRFKLRVLGDRTGFRNEMQRAGVTVIAEADDDLRVSVPTGWTTNEFFKLAERNAVVVRSLLRDDETLEELFLKSVSSLLSPARGEGSQTMSTPTDSLLRYRPWKGELRPPGFASVAMARFALRLLFRRKLFWALYGLAVLVFFFYFFGQYWVVWVQQFTADKTVPIAGARVRVSDFTKFLDALNLNGSAYTFANFIWFEGYVAMIVLAFAGAVLVGNDFHHGSLPYYLSKPIGRRHYVLGKVLGVGAFVNLMTTLPAILLFVQAGLLFDWRTYYIDNFHLLLGILGYGLVLTITLGLLLVAMAVLVRRTVPLVMIWTGIFVLCRALGGFLSEVQRLGSTWRLIDLWNDLYLIGLFLLGGERTAAKTGFDQPPVWQAAIVVAAVCAASWLVLRRRIQAVEVIG